MAVRLVLAVAILAILSSACGKTVNMFGPSSYVVDVTVLEALLPTSGAGIIGAQIKVMEGPEAGADCWTNSFGKCTIDVGLAGMSGTVTPLLLCVREGFFEASARFVVSGSVASATFTMVRESTPSLAGDYDVSVTAASSCGGLSPGHTSFATSAKIAHTTTRAHLRLDLPIPAKCNYLIGIVRLNGLVELGHDADCDPPRAPGPLTLASPPPLLVTAEGSWSGQPTGGDLTLLQSGTIAVADSRVNELCQAPDHKWELRRK